MKKLFVLTGFILIFLSCKNQNLQENSTIATINNETQMENINTIYQFKVTSLIGEEFDFSSLKGKKVMIVNTASKCGLTPQYEGLQKIYIEYRDLGFEIVGFPANNFAQQEPGTNTEIATFCERNYGVTFPMMDKISVTGEDMAPIYRFLTSKSKNGLEDSEVAWNFQKYLINREGKLEKVISPKTEPTSEEIINWIKS